MSTIKEISAATGFSLSTVSIVMRGQGTARGITKETQSKIIKAARTMGYSPNISARRLRGSSEKHTVVVYWPTDYRAGLVFRFLQGIYSELGNRTAQYEIIIYPYAPDKLCQSATVENLSSYSAAIISTASETDLQYLSNCDVVTPVVLYNRSLDNYPCVLIDSYGMGISAAHKLLESDVDRGIILSSQKTYNFAQKRIEGFVEGFSNSGKEYSLVLADTSDPDSVIVKLSEQIFASGERIGIFCTTDHLLPGVYKFLKSIGMENSVQLVSISTMDNKLFSDVFGNISMINVPMEKMGCKCMELIEEIIKGNNVDAAEYMVDF
ncbi:MAG: LacI family DNA-binding transcriptional regulator [Oscillospiraceae bacterium]|nr:LacI family DNA-binding transcriptional regulator [Oscillospiraceae bacterium]